MTCPSRQPISSSRLHELTCRRRHPSRPRLRRAVDFQTGCI